MQLYIDISAVSYLIPLVVGVVVAIGSAVYFRLRKIKSSVSKKLGIDENAGKEVEEELVIKEDTDSSDNKD